MSVPTIPPRAAPDLPPASPERRVLARRLACMIPAASGLALGVVGLYPGCIAVASCFSWLMLTMVVLVVLYVWANEVQISGMRFGRAFLLFAGVVAMVFVADAHLPARLAFPLFRPAFERALHRDPRLPRGDEWIGIYRIRQVSLDPCGGVRFELNSVTGWVGFEYGFVHTASQAPVPDGRGGLWIPHGMGEETPIDASWSIFVKASSIF